MADTKITALAAISSVDPAVDPLAIVDVSDTSMAASGTTKKITSNQILGAGGVATLASATITGAATFNGNTTLGDAQTDTATINGQLTARQGEFPSAVRAAASDYAAVTFDGATAATRITSTMTSQAFSGTGDFTIWSRFRVPVTNIGSNSIILGLSDSNIAVSTANSFYILINTAGGELTVAKRSAANAFQNAFNVAGFSAAYAGQIVDLIVARVSGAWKCYINGTDVTPGTTNFAGETVSFTYCHVGLGGTAQTLNTQVFRSVVFNRALSAADVTELITIGVNPADQWGTQTAVYTSDFSVNTDGWSAANGTAAGNIDGIGGQDNNLRYTIGSGANTADGLSRSSTVIPSKRYRLNFSYYIPSGQTQINTIRAFVGLASVVTGLNVTNAWTDVSAEGVVTGDTSLRVNQNFVGTGNGTDVFYIRAVTATRIGAIVDLDFTIGTGYQATDRSTNNLHGTLFNGVEFTQPKRVAVLYATTNTNGNQQILGGTLAIPTNAIIEDIIVNSTGSATVSVGNASAGTQIVNGASVVSGRQRLTLATPFSTTGNLWVNSSSTATLQFTILYTIAS
jgi:hypothetical protein